MLQVQPRNTPFNYEVCVQLSWSRRHITSPGYNPSIILAIEDMTFDVIFDTKFASLVSCEPKPAINVG
jgi:hypothetical protein